MDYYSKWAEAGALPSKCAVGIAHFLYSLFCRHWVPKRVQSDQGREFVNSLNESLFTMTGVKHLVSTAYHPQTNGLDERFNQTHQELLDSSLHILGTKRSYHGCHATVSRYTTQGAFTGSQAVRALVFAEQSCMTATSKDPSVRPSVHVQLAEIYGVDEERNLLRVEVCPSQQQEGTHDFGLYVIAYATELAHGGGPRNITYIQGAMRNHFSRALLMQTLQPFPRAYLKCRVCTRKIVTIHVHCYCKLPEAADSEMVECEICMQWYHFQCVGLVSKPRRICKSCKTDVPATKRRRLH